MIPSIRIDNRCIDFHEEVLISLLNDLYSSYDELCDSYSSADFGPDELKLWEATFIQYTSLLQFVYSFCNLSVWRFPDGYHKLVNLCSGDLIPRGAVNILPFDD